MSVEDTVRGMWKALSARDWDSLKTVPVRRLHLPRRAGRARRGGTRSRRHRQADPKIGIEPLESYENFDGLMLDNGTDVMYEHHEEWHWPTGESAV